MSTQPLAHVNPGDRITAAFINSMIDEINALQQAGSPSSSGTAPSITGLQPSAQVAEGSTLDILGANFAVPATQNIVTLGGVSVTGFLAGSTDTDLKIAVPALPNVPVQAQLTVETTAGSAGTSIQVVGPSAAIPTGHPTVTNVSATMATNSYIFTFQVDASGVSTTETYTVQAMYTNPQPSSVLASAWQSATTFIGLSGSTVTVVPGTPVTIGVQVTVPANATSVGLALDLISLHNPGPPPSGSNGGSGTIPITVGSAPPQTDSRISVTLDTSAIGPAAPFKSGVIPGYGSGILVKYAPSSAGRTVQIPISATFDVAGNYQFAISIETPDTTLWSVGNVSPNPFAYPEGDNAVTFPLTLLATAPSNETKYIDVVATLQGNSQIGAISNYARFPITGEA